MRFVALALWSAALVTYLVVAPGSTDRRLLRAGAFRQVARSWRGGWVRALCALLAWPHLLELLLGLHRRPARQHEFDEVWRLGPAVIRRYRAVGRRRGDPVLLVHSVVTRPTILDLAPGRSFVGALVEAGHDVYLLDWGHPTPAQATAGFESYVATLQLARQFVLAFTARRQLHLVGYCAGAMLALAAARDEPAKAASVVAIAGPGDTSSGWGMEALLGTPALRPAWLLDADGLVPAPLVREAFHVLRPQALRSVLGVWRRTRRDPAYAPIAASRARWVWEQVPLPGALAFDLADRTRANALLERFRPLTLPLLIAVADRDHIVPPASSLALASVVEAPGTAEVFRCASGHVAMLSGAAAGVTLFPAVTEWLQRVGDRGTTVSA